MKCLALFDLLNFLKTNTFFSFTVLVSFIQYNISRRTGPISTHLSSKISCADLDKNLTYWVSWLSSLDCFWSQSDQKEKLSSCREQIFAWLRKHQFRQFLVFLWIKEIHSNLSFWKPSCLNWQLTPMYQLCLSYFVFVFDDMVIHYFTINNYMCWNKQRSQRKSVEALKIFTFVQTCKRIKILEMVYRVCHDIVKYVIFLKLIYFWKTWQKYFQFWSCSIIQVAYNIRYYVEVSEDIV